MMKKILFLLIIVNFLACENKDVKYNLVNETEFVIDSIVLSNGLDESRLYDIRSKDNNKGHLNFSSQVKTDGNYELKIYSQGVTKSQSFGYYSNGTPADSHFDFIIKNDTIIVKEKF